MTDEMKQTFRLDSVISFKREGNSLRETNTLAQGIEFETIFKLNEALEWKDQSENPKFHVKVQFKPLKRQENLHLKMSSVYGVCWIFLQTFQTYFCIPANSVDPEEQSGLGSHCLQKWLLKSQADDKADDNYCVWRLKG